MAQESSMSSDVPESVLNYIRFMFATVNDHVSQKISKLPNAPEESLDISFLDKLSDYSGQVTVESGWAVQIATHFIGSIRHYRRYEIADIGSCREGFHFTTGRDDGIRRLFSRKSGPIFCVVELTIESSLAA